MSVASPQQKITLYWSWCPSGKSLLAEAVAKKIKASATKHIALTKNNGVCSTQKKIL